MAPQITFKKEHYTERAKKMLEDLLTSSFLNTNPYSLDDAGLEDFFKNRSEGYIQSQSYTEPLEMVIHNFCTIGKNAGHTTNEYNGRIYDTALISFGEDKILGINYRQFRCQMKPIANILENKFSHDTVNNCFVHSSVTRANNSIDNIFYKADDKQILYAYHFPTYDDYGKQRNCYRLLALFSYKLNFHDVLRRQLVESQWFVLHHILRYPSLYAPMTRMYIGKDSSEWAIWSDPAKFFMEICDKDYRALFEEKLQETTQIMNAKMIKPIDVF